MKNSPEKFESGSGSQDELADKREEARIESCGSIVGIKYCLQERSSYE